MSGTSAAAQGLRRELARLEARDRQEFIEACCRGLRCPESGLGGRIGEITSKSGELAAAEDRLFDSHKQIRKSIDELENLLGEYPEHVEALKKASKLLSNF